ncbi:uncharacterized protein LOC121233774 isoform X3 [Aquila chrysaetos chrysaetos]|uniref:uncharacterized protein LOC121233774 isoform X3 n=1 Tax=Aquila chrysaetos chrysaetos TaxID=223781 RepID=UPI001B7D38FD|nr:uncharacterized protein LOC121233774 isoform X3 [Aquila chrysaetos chrysaetos]
MLHRKLPHALAFFSLPQEREYGHECDPSMLSTNAYPTFTFRKTFMTSVLVPRSATLLDSARCSEVVLPLRAEPCCPSEQSRAAPGSGMLQVPRCRDGASHPQLLLASLEVLQVPWKKYPVVNLALAWTSDNVIRAQWV